MTTQDDLDQLLWDYVFGLLEPAEARALESRITSEHDVAKAYAEVRQRADLLAAAARLQNSPIVLTAPSDGPPLRPVLTAPPSNSYWTISWLLASSALALAVFAGFSWQRHGWWRDSNAVASAEQELAAKFRRITVTGPAAVQPATSNLFTVQLSDLNGAVQSEEFAYALIDTHGEVLAQHAAASNADGIGYVTVDGAGISDEAKLRVWCPASPDGKDVQLNLARAKPQVQTYLACDNGVYRPGETVFFRSLVLPTLVNEADAAGLNYKVIAPDGAAVETERMDVKGRVNLGAIALGEQATTGRYILQIENADDEPLQQVRFEVQSTAIDDWRAQLTVPEDRIAPGERVLAQLEATTTAGEPVANAQVDCDVRFNGQPLTVEDPKKTNDQGKTEFSFRLPENEVGQAEMAVKLAKGEKELLLSRTWKVQPAENGPAPSDLYADAQKTSRGIELRFYPEGGALFAGVRNNVYFEAVDAQQKPVQFYGCVVDSKKKAVAIASTLTNGRGAFALTPDPHETYFIEAAGEKAALQKSPVPLPPVSKEPASKLAAANPLVASGEPLCLEIATTKPAAQLLVAATKGDALIGQRVVELKTTAGDELAIERIELPVADAAEGILHVTLFDLASSPPQAVSTRQVYRAPAKYLTLSLEEKSAAAASRIADWTVHVRDEQNSGCAATLGINVLTEEGQPAASPAGSLAASWYLPVTTTTHLAGKTPAVDHFFRHDLSLLNFSLTANEFGSPLLDRPTHFSGSGRLGEVASGIQTGITAEFGFGAETVAGTSATSTFATTASTAKLAPAIVDNLHEVQAAYEEAVLTWRDAGQQRLRTMALTVCAISLALLLAVALLATLRVAGRPLGWMPALTTAMVALFMGSVSLRVEHDRPIQIALKPIANHTPAPHRVAMLDDGTARGSDPTPIPSTFEHDDLLFDPMGAPKGPVILSSTIAGADERDEAILADQPIADKLDGTPLAFGRVFTHVAPSPNNFAWYWREMLSSHPSSVTAPRGGAEAAVRDERFGVHRSSTPPLRFVQPSIDKMAGSATDDQTFDGATRSSATLYWNPVLKANEQGVAHFRFTVPPGVRYRILVDAHSDRRVGSLERWVEPRAEAHLLPSQE